jgi:hypothetical protein
MRGCVGVILILCQLDLFRPSASARASFRLRPAKERSFRGLIEDFSVFPIPPLFLE